MKLSIITINYNNYRGLQKTLNSIIDQTNQDFEWIVIDGGSTDGSKELLEMNADYISYWVSEPDKGIYHAMNKGIDVAKGDFLQFLNSGDSLADENIIEKFLKRNNTEDVIYGNAIFVDENDSEVRRFHAPNFVRLSFFYSHSLNHQATFFSKRCFLSYRYNENNKVASDLELSMYLLYNGFTFIKWDVFVVRYDNTGLSSVDTGIGEFSGIVKRILPPGVKADYDEIIQFRDVDLAIMIKTIINSNKFLRYLTRIVLYPVYGITKLFYN